MTMSLSGTSGLTMPGGQTQIGALTSGTAVASTSGTSIDFTSIPSWIKRITVMFSGVSTNGASLVQIQLGAGSVATSGYVASATNNAAASIATVGSAAGFAINSASAANSFSGQLVLSLLSGNSWVASGSFSSGGPNVFTSAGGIALGGTLDRLRITTVNGTDTFDAGSINILYE